MVSSLCAPQVVGSSSKTLSFRKPNPDDVFSASGSAEASAAAAAAEVRAEAMEDE